MDVRESLDKEILIFDGAMGTMLQSRGLQAGELPELLNIKKPEEITAIHRGYIDAGARIITTNTFGANEIKLMDKGFTVEEVVHAAVCNAMEAIGGTEVFIALDIGPIGELLEPMGTLTFDEAYNIFKRQVIQGVKSGVDLILIETMTDLYEAKAAVLAAKENSNLPVFCTMSFEGNMRTFTGCSVDSMVMVLQGLGVDALGVNCSLGPKELAPIVDRILHISKVPVIVQPNAGLPTVLNDCTVFELSPKEFGDWGYRFVKKGVRVVGGCCGTNYDHIEELTDKIGGMDVQDRPYISFSGVCTSTKTVFIDGIKVIGERINPTGRKNSKAPKKWEYGLYTKRSNRPS